MGRRVLDSNRSHSSFADLKEALHIPTPIFLKGILLLKVSMASVTPFTVAVPNNRLERLQAKLVLTEFPDELNDAGWDYGAPLADVKRLTAYWKDEFDWKKQEANINKLPQFQTQIKVDGHEQLKIHFIHQKSGNSKAIPLLFVHGCRFLQPNGTIGSLC